MSVILSLVPAWYSQVDSTCFRPSSLKTIPVFYNAAEYVLHKEGIMTKIQARNVDNALHALVKQPVMKNEHSLEGNIRIAL